MTAEPTKAAGFTLLEVLVALAVVAVALGAAVSAAATYADGSDHLRTRAVAQWVALNRLTEAQLAGSGAREAADSGVVEMAGRQWRWSRRVAATADALVHRISVDVAPAETPDDVRARVTGFAAAVGPVGR